MFAKKEFTLIFIFSFLIVFILYFSLYSEKPQKISIKEVVSELKKEEPPQDPIQLFFVGDIMLDRTIRKDGELYGYNKLFSCLEKDFSTYDRVIGNLEGTITNFTSVSRDASYESPESFRFTFDIKAVETLKDLGLTTVSLGNNHIKDFGNEGIQQTISNINELEINYFGDPRKESVKYFIDTIHDTKIAFIPYNQFFGTKEQVFEDLKTTQDISDIQIIFAHWGDEYTPARSDIKILAHQFADAGADLIIGAHPHVIQEKEVYKNVPIYYSLGNFIFDQYWEESVREGLGVQVEIKNKKIKILGEKKFESTRHKGTCAKAPTS